MDSHPPCRHECFAVFASIVCDHHKNVHALIMDQFVESRPDDFNHRRNGRGLLSRRERLGQHVLFFLIFSKPLRELPDRSLRDSLVVAERVFESRFALASKNANADIVCFCQA